MGATTRHTCRLFICLALVITCLPGGASASAPEAPQSQPDILVSIVMHNEEPRMGHYPDFVNDEVAF
ncbi:MAG: hypothetical protein L6435_10880 [Anaerolineae bacterium]|nr:hypothetical protein [Anaerolineae bacterium]